MLREKHIAPMAQAPLLAHPLQTFYNSIQQTSRKVNVKPIQTFTCVSAPLMPTTLLSDNSAGRSMTAIPGGAIVVAPCNPAHYSPPGPQSHDRLLLSPSRGRR